METINLKNYQNSKEYIQGQQDFQEKRIKNPGVKFAWYKAKVTKDKYASYYEKIPGYTFMGEDGKDCFIGFASVIPPEGCLEITDMNDLMKIQMHREACHYYPQPMEKKETISVQNEIDVNEIQF